jgi:hypothetical protein
MDQVESAAVLMGGLSTTGAGVALGEKDAPCSKALVPLVATKTWPWRSRAVWSWVRLHWKGG